MRLPAPLSSGKYVLESHTSSPASARHKLLPRARSKPTFEVYSHVRSIDREADYHERK